jgi:hypothetical protein
MSRPVNRSIITSRMQLAHTRGNPIPTSFPPSSSPPGLQFLASSSPRHRSRSMDAFSLLTGGSGGVRFDRQRFQHDMDVCNPPASTSAKVEQQQPSNSRTTGTRCPQ